MTDAGLLIPPAHTESLPVAAPYNLLATIRLLHRRPVNRVDRWEDGRYVRLLATPGGLRLVSVANEGSIEEPQLRLDIYGDSVEEADRLHITKTIRWMLGLDAEPAPLAWLVEQEPCFEPVARVLRGFRIPCFADLWEASFSVLPFQQLSLDAGIAIHGRLVERWGMRLEIGGRAWRGVPTPESMVAADPTELREAGLSRAKITAVKALARIALDGGLDPALFQPLPTDEARRELVKLPGIGPWSADILLLRGLRRVDLFPPGDTGSARGVTALLDAPALLTPVQASEYAQRFGDCRAYLYFLSLGNKLISKGILPAE